MILLQLISIGVLLATSVDGYGSGAPIPTCESMAPGHPGTRQTIPSPYKIKIWPITATVNQPVEIILTSNSGRDEFKGFLAQVRVEPQRDQNGRLSARKEAVGSFEENSDPKAKLLSCQGIKDNAMTHNSKEAKTEVKLKWIPSQIGVYRVHVTFVKDYNTFWVNQTSLETIDVYPSAGHHPNTDVDFTTILHNIEQLCSTMVLNESYIPQEYPSHFIVQMQPIVPGKEHHPDSHKVEQKGLLQINITSDEGTPIDRAFVQVRRKGQQPNQKLEAFGRFILEGPKTTSDSKKYNLVNCFGEKENSLLFVNQDLRYKVQELKLKWEAPQDQTGEFELVGSLLQDEFFWDHLVKDKEMTRIHVVAKGKSAAATAGKGKPNKSEGNVPEVKLALILFFLFVRLL